MTTPVIDFAAVARGFGATGHLVWTRDDLEEALSRPTQGPLVLDVRVDPSVRLEGSQRVASLRLFTSQ
jgi:thiamine pyrophosphate-dependent acetolactate synthase large subunit-like protein